MVTKKTLSVGAPAAGEDSLLPGAAMFQVTTTPYELGQLFAELTTALGPDASFTVDESETITLYVLSTDVNIDTVSGVLSAHVPVRHFGYTSDQKALHDIALKTKLGTALTDAEKARQMEALFALQNGVIGTCDCTTPLNS